MMVSDVRGIMPYTERMYHIVFFVTATRINGDIFKRALDIVKRALDI